MRKSKLNIEQSLDKARIWIMANSGFLIVLGFLVFASFVVLRISYLLSISPDAEQINLENTTTINPINQKTLQNIADSQPIREGQPAVNNSQRQNPFTE